MISSSVDHVSLFVFCCKCVWQEELSLSVQRTQNLQQQLSDLQQQKNDAVQKLETEVEEQINIVRQSEEENSNLKAKVS